MENLGPVHIMDIRKIYLGSDRKETSRCFEVVANPVGKDKSVLWEGLGVANQVPTLCLVCMVSCWEERVSAFISEAWLFLSWLV